MDLIERYLAAVGRQLPAKEAGDIQSELRDVLLNRVEEREAELGRPLNQPEVESLLIEFGHPLLVAARYRKTQHLIGPEVFPFWWAAQKTMLAIVGGVYLMLIAVGVATHMTAPQFNHAVPQLPYVVVYLFGLITLIFLGIERFGTTRFLRDWKPANLPPAGGKRRSRFELAAEITWDLIFIAW